MDREGTVEPSGDISHYVAAGVTLNRSLYERVLRDLLVERAEHTVELYEGSGASWMLARCCCLFRSWLEG